MIYIFQMMILQIATMDCNYTKVVDELLTSTYKQEWSTETFKPNRKSRRGQALQNFIPQQDLAQNDSYLKRIGSIEITFLDPLYYEERVLYGLAYITFQKELVLTDCYSVWEGYTNFVYQNQYELNLGYSEISCQIYYEISFLWIFQNYCKLIFIETIEEPEEQLKEGIQIGIYIQNKQKDNSKCDFFESLYIYDTRKVSQGIHKQLTPQNQTPTTLPDQLILDYQVFFYRAMLNVLNTISIFCVIKLIKKIQLNEDQLVQNISIFPVIFVIRNEFYLGYFNLIFASKEDEYFYYQIFDVIFYWLFCMGIDLILCYQILKKQLLNQQIYDQMVLCYIYSSAILFPIALIISLWEDNDYKLLQIIGHYMIPQIIYNIRIGSNPTFIPEYIFGFLSLKVAVPLLYIKGYIINFSFFYLEVDFCIYFVLIYLISIFILYYQYKKCPHKNFQKEFKYYQQCTSEESDKCAICLLDLIIIKPDQQEQDLDGLLENKVLMITPCGHKFHPHCLKTWMQVQLTCPCCRNTIPPIRE